MKLQSKHLLPYLNHKLMCQVTDLGKTKVAEMHSVYFDDSCTFCDTIESEKGFSEIKPILRPLSKSEIMKLWDEKHSEDPDIRTFLNEQFIEDKGFENIDEMLDYNPEWWATGTFNVLAKYHFDIFGLITKELALNVNKVVFS